MNFSKENFKFSSSHFTMFNATEAERLHGHNYSVSLSLKTKDIDSELGMAIDFNEIKKIIKEACDFLDEYILIPENSGFLKINQEGQQIQVNFANKVYSLPESDVRLLALSNVTCEELAKYLALKISYEIKSLNQQHKVKIEHINLTVQETSGQSVSYEMSI